MILDFEVDTKTLIEEFENYMRAMHYQPATITSYVRDLQIISLSIGFHHPAEITSGDIKTFLDETTFSRARIKSIFSALRTFLSWCFQTGATTSDLSNLVPVVEMRVERPPRKILTLSEAKELVRGADSPKDQLVMRLLLIYGFASRDIARIRLEQARDIITNGRAKFERGLVSFGEETIEAFMDYIDEHYASAEDVADGQLFPGLTNSGVRYSIKKTLKETSIKEVPTSTDLRYTAVYLAHQAGMSIYDLHLITGYSAMGETYRLLRDLGLSRNVQRKTNTHPLEGGL